MTPTASELKKAERYASKEWHRYDDVTGGINTPWLEAYRKELQRLLDQRSKT